MALPWEVRGGGDEALPWGILFSLLGPQLSCPAPYSTTPELGSSHIPTLETPGYPKGFRAPVRGILPCSRWVSLMSSQRPVLPAPRWMVMEGGP